jgi:hypothetical protein
MDLGSACGDVNGKVGALWVLPYKLASFFLNVNLGVCAIIFL